MQKFLLVGIFERKQRHPFSPLFIDRRSQLWSAGKPGISACPEGEQDVFIETDLDRSSSPALFGRRRSTDDHTVCVDGRRSAQLYVGFLVFLRLNRVSSAIELLVNRRRWGAVAILHATLARRILGGRSSCSDFSGA